MHPAAGAGISRSGFSLFVPVPCSSIPGCLPAVLFEACEQLQLLEPRLPRSVVHTQHLSSHTHTCCTHTQAAAQAIAAQKQMGARATNMQVRGARWVARRHVCVCALVVGPAAGAFPLPVPWVLMPCLAAMTA